jgi:hypothetical protein
MVQPVALPLYRPHYAGSTAESLPFTKDGIFFLDVPRFSRGENFCSRIAKLRPLVLLILVLLAEDKETGWNDNDMKQVLGGNFVKAPISPPQNLPGLAQYRTQATDVSLQCKYNSILVSL